MTGVTINWDKDQCTGCGICAQGICFLDAINLHRGKVQRDSDKCRMCGRCAENCPQNAITIKLASDAVERSLERIKPLVDVKTE